MLRNILGRLFAFWAMLVFIPTMLIAFPLIWASKFWPEPTSNLIFLKVSRAWMRVFFFFSFVRLRIRGREHFEKNRSYIVVCNHNSFMDVPVVTPFIPGPNRTIAKKEMASIPIFGIIYQRGSVLVDRKRDDSRKQSYLQMREVLSKGLHMAIYPEGTRNKTKEPLQYFHNGAFKLAMDTGHAIMPAILFNTAKVLPPGKKFYWWPSTIEMHFLPPIEVADHTMEDLKDETFQIMKDYYVAHRKQ